MILKKNDYLNGLEKIYQKYGIVKVYSWKPGTDTYQNNEFFLNKDISQDVLLELERYMTSEDDSYYGMNIDWYSGDVRDLQVFYEFGRFYGEVSNAH